MIQIVLFVLSLVLVFAAVVARGAYIRIGRDAQYPDYISPNQQRAMHFIGRHKDFVSQILNIVLGVFVAVALYLSTELVGVWSLLFAFIFIEIVFFLLPAVKIPSSVERLAYLLAPLIRKTAEKLGSLEKKFATMTSKIKSDQLDTGIYTLSDLKHFFKNQIFARDNQIKDFQLNNLVSRIEFDDKKASDIMVKLSKVRTVGASEPLGPILINELHETGFKYFPVEEEFNKEIIGILELDSLTSLQKQGDAKDAMEGRITYIDKDRHLRDVLDEAFRSGSPVFLCVNDDQKPVGIISLQQVVEELAGEKPAQEEPEMVEEEE